MWKRKTVWPRHQTLANLNTRTDALMTKEMIKRGNFSLQPNFFHLSAITFVLRTMFPNTWVCVSACSYICVCVPHACTRFKERGIEESAKESERLETGWGMTGWIWLRVWNGWKGLWCRTFSIEHSWVQAGAGSTTPGRPLPEGPSVKKTFSEQIAGQDSHLGSSRDRKPSLDPSQQSELWMFAAGSGSKGLKVTVPNS